MVSTRLMSNNGSNSNCNTNSPAEPATPSVGIVNGSSTSGGGGPSGSTVPQILNPLEFGPAKFTRNSVTAMAGYSGPGGGPSTSTGLGAVQCVRVQNVPVQSIKFLDLPQEVIEKILGYLSFKEICKLRLVSRRIDQICGYILNSTFSKLQNQMLQRFQDIKSKMPRRESARRSHYLACESDIVETLHMRLTLLQMSFGKHIERKHICFFPGEILDEVYSILHYIRTTPRLDLPYKVTDELFDLSTMAMEYFKEKIEPNLPEIAYFSTDFLGFSSSFTSPNSTKYGLESSNLSSDSSKVDHNDPDVLDGEEFVEIPQSNMVLRKRIRKIKQGMKRYNNQLSVLRNELKVCKKKTAEQQKQITDQQKQLADQQKQTLEYATRLDDYDKKNEEISRKFSTLLQELNKCKTELQYWRCKSPATPTVCTSCGSPVIPQPEELQALVNQGVNPEGLGLDPLLELAATAQNPAEQGTSKNIDEEPANKIIENLKECQNPIKDVEAAKKAESPPGSPGPASRSAKRKSSSEEREEDQQQPKKKSRRLTKVRSKRSTAKV
ncbi:F-box only protein 28 [Anthonomus grandis grandis]|uniref:F-box only protein 28 n=1 Tax=Anthonomus grandis grandis TaxID=2921223 RepID=UPI002165087E|nr:F-box only protein 28 [Anthonomus grandis grandis]XP_050305178.1 F-box only protein 28 [Anthonomus grandis grandis]